MVWGLSAVAAPLAGADPLPPGAVAITMTSSPALSPDGATLVFEWQDDLWATSSNGGLAKRLTRHPARDAYPCFSPDGKTLYFSSGRAGGLKLFSMPAEGGTATQLTFHSEGAILESITPDGKTAIVRGPRDLDDVKPERLIAIDLTKDAPERLLFDVPAQWARVSPDGGKLLFTVDGDSPYRKGYHGSRATSVWSYEFGSGKFQSHGKSEIEDRYPLWKPDGSGFFHVSERDGTFNLWSRDTATGKDEQLTRFKDDGLMFPTVSADGKTFVFRRGFDLWRWSPGNEPRALTVYAVEDMPDLEHETRKVAGTTDADFSPSGLEIAFSAEGELWAMDTVLKEPHRLTDTPAWEGDPNFSKDGAWLYFRKDDGIDSNYFRMRRNKTADFWWRASGLEEQKVTKGKEPKTKLSISPDGKMLAYISGRGLLCTANADGGGEKVIYKDGNTGLFDWSPDSRWLVFDAEDENFNRDIFIAPVDGSKPAYDLSRHPDTEGSPKWSPDGRMIAFTGRRLANKTGLFYVHLRLDDEAKSPRDKKTKEAESAMKDDPLYKVSQPAEAPGEPEPAAEPAKKEATPKKPAAKTIEPVRIDFDELSERIHKLDTGTVEPTQILWTQDSKAVLYLNADTKIKGLHRIEVGETSKPELFDSNRGTPIRTDDKEGLFWIVDNTPAVLRKGKLTTYAIDTRFESKRSDRQRVYFRQIWRTLRDWFYDGRMNGRDWEAMRVKYEEAAATATDSRAFDRVVAMLLGELNASHLSFLSNPWPKPWTDDAAEFHTTRHVGIRFDHGTGSGPLKVGSVIPESPAALCEPPVKAGETVVSVDGQPVDANTPDTRFLNGRMDRDITFTLLGADGKNRDVTLRAIPWTRVRELAGDAIVKERRRRVEEGSGNKLGYIHISKMQWDQFEEFERQIHAAGHGKDGLVIDVRDNPGGFTTDHLLTILCQPRHATTIGRDGAPGYPQDRMVYASWNKPIVVLCNQQSFSNAEVFSHAIKTLKRGPLVGTATAGGVISTGTVPVLDAGSLRLPFRGWFIPDGDQDMELNGAAPDYPVEETPADQAAGKDPQLSKAIEVLTDTLRKSAATAKPFEPHYRYKPEAGR
ncbi:tricorn protease [Luteolibacter sp. LG18]|nr:tricorn protease [Luteolibacter sp. LG18]